MSPAAVFLPYQSGWIEDPAQVKLWEKSRRIGASFCEAADNVLHAASGKGNVGYISYAKDMTENYIADCASWAKKFDKAAGEIGESIFTRDDDRDIHVFDIRFASGNFIKAFSNNPRNLRSFGRPGDIVVIDEAAFVDDLSELLKAAMAVTMWGGKVRIMSTHNGAANPFNNLIEDIRKGRYQFNLHRTDLDEALADGLHKKICEVTKQKWTPQLQQQWRAATINFYRPNEDEELFVIPAMGGGTYFPRVLVESRMPTEGQSGKLIRFEATQNFNLLPKPSRRLEMISWLDDNLLPELQKLDPSRRHVIGQDFARSGDMTSIVVLEIGETLHRTWKTVFEMHNTPYDQQDQALEFIEKNTPRLGMEYVDSTGNGDSIGESAQDRRGSMVVRVKFSENVHRERWPKYKVQLEDGTTTLIRHDDILEDHRSIKVVNGIPRPPKGKTDKANKRHGDSAVAGMLADWAADDRSGGPALILSAGKTSDNRLTHEPNYADLSKY